MSATELLRRSAVTSRRRVLATIGAACILVSSLAGLAAAGQAHAAGEVILDHQHTDAVSVRYEDDRLVLKTRADLDAGAGVILDPADVLFHVTDAQQDVVPDVSDFAFLGDPGSPIWKISQTYQPGVLWAGWETESLPKGVFRGNQIELSLTEITGPGQVELYLNDIDGPRRLLSSTEPSLRMMRENVGAHTHANWVFTQAGTYRFTFVAEAERTTGGTVVSEPRTYTFLVGSGSETPSPSPTATESASPSPSVTETPKPTPTPSMVTPQPSSTSTPSTPAAPTASPTRSAVADDSVDESVVPSSPLAAPDAADLTEANRGDVSVSSSTVAPGGQVTVGVSAEHSSSWVSAWMLSDPADLGWKQVNGDGEFTVAVPPDAEEGEHRLVIRDRNASLVGWADLQVVDPEAAVEECVATPVTTTVRPDSVDVADSGHFDFGPVEEGASFRALLKDDRSAPAQWRDPSEIVFHLDDAASAEAPGGQFDFLGSGTVWQIPLTQQSGVPWLGWNTQHPTVAGRADGPVTLTLDGLDGPGELAVYSVNSWGQLGEKYFGTVSGFPRATSIEVGASGVHVHGIWAFTEPGAYHATLTFAGTVGGERMSATSTLTFFVGDGDPRSAVHEEEVTTYVGRTTSGEDCELEAGAGGASGGQLAETGFSDPKLAGDLTSLAVASLLVGLAFLGASALAPRRRELPATS